MWTIFNRMLDDKLSLRDSLIVKVMIASVYGILNDKCKHVEDISVKSYLDSLVKSGQLGVYDMVLVENDRLLIVNFSVDVKYSWMQVVFIKKECDIDCITLNDIKF